MRMTHYSRDELRERRILFRFSRGEISAAAAMKKLKIRLFWDLCVFYIRHAIALRRLTRKQCDDLADVAPDFRRFSAALGCAKRIRLSRSRNSGSMPSKRRDSSKKRRRK